MLTKPGAACKGVDAAAILTLENRQQMAIISLDFGQEAAVDRIAMGYLREWKRSSRRKPLVLRGARQVGKSYLVRQFGREKFENLVEINFELDGQAAALFESLDPREIVPRLELHTGSAIRAGKTLLFLDELQAAPKVIPSLRYFRELMPDLHVVAAGSLLDFALGETEHSMPVGRIEYLHMGPMTFEEHLLAGGHDRKLEYLRGWTPGLPVDGVAHQRLMGFLRTYLVVGGMPEAQAVWHESGSLRSVEDVKQSILTTYEEDFAKYRGRVDVVMMRGVFRKLPLLIGRKLVYTAVDRNARARAVGGATDLLCRARVATKVKHTDAVGVPLGATVDDRKFKVLFLDVGLAATACGLSLLDLERADDVTMVNSGAICEQLVGQHLLHSARPNVSPELCYWVREKRNAAAEVDYVLASGPAIYPLEVKAGSSGKLKSMQVFLLEKGLRFGVRLDSNPQSLIAARTALPGDSNIGYDLLSLPLYMVGQVPRLAAWRFRSHS